MGWYQCREKCIFSITNKWRLAGLAGGIEVAGSLGKVVVGASSGYGFNGIPVALIAHNNPILIIFFSIAFGSQEELGLC